MYWIEMIPPRTLSATALICVLASCSMEQSNSIISALDTEAGARTDSHGFGQSVRTNTGIQNGDPRFRLKITQKFADDVPNTINFAFNESTLSQSSKEILRLQASWIKQFPEVHFRVYGHTDAVGTTDYNQALGLRRAQAVVKFLIAQDIDPSRLEAVASFGETRPLVLSGSQELKNRRTVTEVFGFIAQHPDVLDGKYAQIIFRDYVASAVAPTGLTGVTKQSSTPNE